MRWALGFVLALVSVAVLPGAASALSCNGRLVEVGDSEGYVRSICGEPTAATTRMEMRSAFVGYPYGYAPSPYGYPYGGYAQAVSVQVDVLVYDFGPTRFIDELTFENGVLRADRIAGYGTVSAAHVRREARRAERAARRHDD
jgi:hypothetical protein